ncbi:MAG TPA: HAMP domain-containing sensor histidine kinase, partial [Kofleriaceae bacterium]|nr:HAMP domain-containing sensor histidine kinase [Kofleriaceae bacterium]
EADQYVSSVQEAVVLSSAKLEVELYLQRSMQPGVPTSLIHVHEARAINALDHLGDLEVAQSRAAHVRATHWDQITTLAGIVLGICIVAVTGALVLWLRRRVIRPLFALADTMKKFGDGDRSLRAAENGPTELREMTQRFNEMADSIAAQRQAQTAFLGGVAHDLRNPLSALKLAVDVMEPSQPLPPEPQLRRTLAIIGRQIDHLDRMVGDFLDMAKIEAGTLELAVGQHDVRTIVQDAVELFAPSARMRFHVTIPDVPAVILCDPVRIGQAVTNLVSNALKYSPPDEPIDIRVAATEHVVTVEVTDRGVGIPREDQNRIFEPFRRGATRNTVPGTGLGLANVQRIINAHGGRIEVESVPAVGSTFRLHLTR